MLESLENQKILQTCRKWRMTRSGWICAWFRRCANFELCRRAEGVVLSAHRCRLMKPITHSNDNLTKSDSVKARTDGTLREKRRRHGKLLPISTATPSEPGESLGGRSTWGTSFDELQRSQLAHLTRLWGCSQDSETPAKPQGS